MKRNKYPCLDHVAPGRDLQRECDACDKPATARVWVQFDYMRGNDEWYAACDRHASMARVQFGSFMEQVGAKFAGKVRP